LGEAVDGIMTHAEAQTSKINDNTNAGFQAQGQILQEILTAVQANAAPRGEPKVRAAPRAKAEPKAKAKDVEPVQIPFLLEQFPAASKVVDGIWYVPKFLEAMGIDENAIFQKLMSLPVQLDSDVIQRDFMNPIIIQGTNTALKMRGHAIPREKCWFQTQPEAGLLRYGYTGWTYAISNAVKDVTCIDEFHEVFQKLNAAHTSEAKFNAFIATIYRTGCENIGEHSDKSKDLAPHSWICLIRLGPRRCFQFLDGRAIVWNENIGLGDAVWLNLETNAKFKHILPMMTSTFPASGSLVFRCVATTVPWERVDKELAKTAQKK